MLTGKKTYIGGVLIGAGYIADALGYGEIGDVLRGLGNTFAVVGIGHKIQRVESTLFEPVKERLTMGWDK